MEPNTEYRFDGYIDIGNEKEAHLNGIGWIDERGVFSWGGVVEPYIDIEKYEDQIFELFQICNKPKKLPECFLNR